jgi:hypothetical protein
MTTDRNLAQIKLQVGKRSVTVRAMDQVGPEDCYDALLRATLHRYATLGREDAMMPIPREVKDWIIRTNLFV